MISLRAVSAELFVLLGPRAHTGGWIAKGQPICARVLWSTSSATRLRLGLST